MSLLSVFCKSMAENYRAKFLREKELSLLSLFAKTWERSIAQNFARKYMSLLSVLQQHCLEESRKFLRESTVQDPVPVHSLLSNIARHLNEDFCKINSSYLILRA